MIKEFTDSTKWNKQVKQADQFFQHYLQWADVKKASWSATQYTFKEYPFQLLNKKFPKEIFKLGYIPPVNVESLKKTDQLDEFLNELPQFAKENNLDFLLLELGTTDSTVLSCAIKAGYREYFEEVQVRNTDVLDLTLGKDQLFANLNGKYRREVRKAIKNNYTTTTYTKPDDAKRAVSQFYEIISSVIGRGNYTTYRKDYFESMFKNYAMQDMAAIHIVHHKDTPNKPLGAYLVLYDTTTAYELYGGTNLEGRKARIGFLLKWDSIVSALAHGAKKYDQWGSAKVDAVGEFIKNDHLYNIAVFKKGFGGKHVSYLPTLVYVNKPMKYFIYSVGMWLKPVVIKGLKLFKR